MGRRGPPPRPDSSETKRGRNTYHQKQTAKAKRQPVAMPSRIRKVAPAAAFWKKYADTLIDSGHLIPAHADMFAMLCLLHADILRYEETLDETGDLITTPRGIPQPHPCVKLLRDARRDFAKLGSDFGMTALATARIPREVEDGEENSNPLEAFGIAG